MRQDKDRGGKWLLAHHGDAILRLGGITGFSGWRALQPETVAPRRLPDGLLEVRFPGAPEPTLVLVEIETYPDADADRQVLDDLMLIAVDRKVVPEVVSLVLKPKGHLTVTGAADRVSPGGRTRVGGSWPVVRLWEQDAEALLASPDAGMIPWVPLARTALGPDELLTRCRDRLVQVPDAGDRNGLLVVTSIFAGLAFPGRDVSNLFGAMAMLDKVYADALETATLAGVRQRLMEQLKPKVKAEVKEEVKAEVKEEVKAEVKEEVKAETRGQTLREGVLAALEARFGAAPAACAAALAAVGDEGRLKALLRVAATCPDVGAFMAALAAGA